MHHRSMGNRMQRPSNQEPSHGGIGHRHVEHGQRGIRPPHRQTGDCRAQCNANNRATTRVHRPGANKTQNALSNRHQKAHYITTTYILIYFWGCLHRRRRRLHWCAHEQSRTCHVLPTLHVTGYPLRSGWSHRCPLQKVDICGCPLFFWTSRGCPLFFWTSRGCPKIDQ